MKTKNYIKLKEKLNNYVVANITDFVCNDFIYNNIYVDGNSIHFRGVSVSINTDLYDIMNNEIREQKCKNALNYLQVK